MRFCSRDTNDANEEDLFHGEAHHFIDKAGSQFFEQGNIDPFLITELWKGNIGYVLESIESAGKLNDSWLALRYSVFAF